MKTYEGDIIDGDCRVFVCTNGRRERNLSARLDLRDHSPTGFAWGYGGSGPSQLALALLADCVGDKEAMDWYQPFKWRVVANLKRVEGWKLSEAQIREVLAVLKAEGQGKTF